MFQLNRRDVLKALGALPLGISLFKGEEPADPYAEYNKKRREVFEKNELANNKHRFDILHMYVLGRLVETWPKIRASAWPSISTDLMKFFDPAPAELTHISFWWESNASNRPLKTHLEYSTDKVVQFLLNNYPNVIGMKFAVLMDPSNTVEDCPWSVHTLMAQPLFEIPEC